MGKKCSFVISTIKSAVLTSHRLWKSRFLAIFKIIYFTFRVEAMGFLLMQKQGMIPKKRWKFEFQEEKKCTLFKVQL
jgi:hypothetical protein